MVVDSHGLIQVRGLRVPLGAKDSRFLLVVLELVSMRLDVFLVLLVAFIQHPMVRAMVVEVHLGDLRGVWILTLVLIHLLLRFQIEQLVLEALLVDMGEVGDGGLINDPVGRVQLLAAPFAAAPHLLDERPLHLLGVLFLDIHEVIILVRIVFAAGAA